MCRSDHTDIYEPPESVGVNAYTYSRGDCSQLGISVSSIVGSMVDGLTKSSLDLSQAVGIGKQTLGL